MLGGITRRASETDMADTIVPIKKGPTYGAGAGGWITTMAQRVVSAKPLSEDIAICMLSCHRQVARREMIRCGNLHCQDAPRFVQNQAHGDSVNRVPHSVASG